LKPTNLSRALLCILGVVLILFSQGKADSRFNSSVRRICNSYETVVEIAKMRLVDQENGVKEFVMQMESSRNNFDRSILVGFYAVGKTIEELDQPIDSVRLIITMQYKGSFDLIAVANYNDIKKFIADEISSRDFMRLVVFE